MVILDGLFDLFANVLTICRTDRPCVVFDLDNTLVYSTELPTNGHLFQIHVRNKRYYVHVRPGACEFLRRINEKYEIYFYTASSREYADLIIRKIAPFVPRNHCFFKDSCMFKYGYALKDLQKIQRPLNKIILIDDMLGSGSLHPLNTIAIEPWNGSFSDRVLSNELFPLLMSCSEEINVAKAVHDKAIASHPKHLYYFAS